MPRPRSYARDDVVETARDVFWEHGYGGTAVTDLETRTGLNRSSLYLAFGSKRELFDEALDAYAHSVIDPLIGRLESPSAGPGSIASFFGGIKDELRTQRADARRGCLMINTIAELPRLDEEAAVTTRAFRDRLHAGFEHALRSSDGIDTTDDGAVRARAGMLTAATIGVWMLAHVDVVDAMALCDQIADLA